MLGERVGDVFGMHVECNDCGRETRLYMAELCDRGASPETPVSEVFARLYCGDCREDGSDGRNITVLALKASPSVRATG